MTSNYHPDQCTLSLMPTILMYSLMLFLLLGTGETEAENDLQSQISKDAEKLVNIRHSLELMTDFLHERPDLFPAEKNADKRLTSREQRQEIWLFWQSFLDRIIVLDQIGSKYEVLYKAASGDRKNRFFMMSYAAFLMQYRYAVKIVAQLENDPSMHTMLNEPVPELGLSSDTYKTIKFRFLNIARAAEFIRLHTVYTISGADDGFELKQGMQSDIYALWKLGFGDGTEQTYKNALKIIEDKGFTVWFPMQKKVSNWKGDVKILRSGYSLISAEQIEHMRELLQPGDILLQRREWYLSNIALPGYWPHAALYIGTDKQRGQYFNDSDINRVYGGANGFEATLKKKYPGAYSMSVAKDRYGHAPSVIEAIGEGVTFTTLEHSADADSVAILRPRISKLEKAKAIERAYHFSGRPYDFNFDFLTDAALVCTELVYKAYEPADGYEGIRFPTRSVIGRPVTTANDIARLYDTEHGSKDQQLDFIAFYDGNERALNAEKSDDQSFRNSWKRPKLYIWVQGTYLEPDLN